MSQLPEAIREVLRAKRKMTVEEYMQLPETNIHMELIDGELNSAIQLSDIFE